MSDSAASNATSDSSGPSLVTICQTAGFVLKEHTIVPDEHSQIRECVERWSREQINLILTTGGTGFGARDTTPEVCRGHAFLHKHASDIEDRL